MMILLFGKRPAYNSHLANLSSSVGSVAQLFRDALLSVVFLELSGQLLTCPESFVVITSFAFDILY